MAMATAMAMTMTRVPTMTPIAEYHGHCHAGYWGFCLCTALASMLAGPSCQHWLIGPKSCPRCQRSQLAQ
eukprot:8330389-Alexandrium_andersonii.AAC.1